MRKPTILYSRQQEDKNSQTQGEGISFPFLETSSAVTSSLLVQKVLNLSQSDCTDVIHSPAAGQD
jgi:hypothetical protein